MCGRFVMIPRDVVERIVREVEQGLSLIHIWRSSEDDSSMTAQELPNGFTGFANRKPGFEPASASVGPVSYTHLDVYKRQASSRTGTL